MGRKKKKNKFKLVRIKGNSETIWESGYAPLKPTVIIDSRLVTVTRYIQRKVGDNEFSILAKGEFKSGIFYVSSEYYIPKQEVTSSSVDYLENIGAKREEGFNTVIHSHPFSNESDFSSADEKHINSHFTCSILVNDEGNPIKAILNIPFQNTVIQVEAKEIYEQAPDITVSEEELSRIQEKTTTYQYTPNQNYTSNRTEDIDEEEEFEREYQRFKEAYCQQYFW